MKSQVNDPADRVADAVRRFVRALILAALGCLLMPGCAGNLTERDSWGSLRMPTPPFPRGARAELAASDEAEDATGWPVAQATAVQPIGESARSRTRSMLPRPTGANAPEGAPPAPDPSTGPLAMAKLCERRGQLAEAQKIYVQLLKANPRDPHANHRMGVVLARLGDFPNAARYFGAALQGNPQNPDLLCDMAYAAYLEGELADAESSLRQSLGIDPNHSKSWNNLGLVLAAQGHDAAALTCFRRITNEAEALANLAYAQAQRGAFQQAQATYLQALSLNNELKTAAKAMLQVARYEQRAISLGGSRESAEPQLGDAAPASPAVLAPDASAQPLAAVPEAARRGATTPPAAPASPAGPTVPQVAAQAAVPASTAPPAPAPHTPASPPQEGAVAIPAAALMPAYQIVLQHMAQTLAAAPTPGYQIVLQGVPPTPEAAAPVPAETATTVPAAAPTTLPAPIPGAAQLNLPPNTQPAALPVSDGPVPDVVSTPVPETLPSNVSASEVAQGTQGPTVPMATRMVGRSVTRTASPNSEAAQPSPAPEATAPAASPEPPRLNACDLDEAAPEQDGSTISRGLSKLAPLR